MTDLVKVTVDGISVEVEPGTTILQACETAGAEIPRFCYHERLSVAGNCRMCLVDVEKAPKPVASCAMPVTPDMVVNTQSESVKAAREGVMEFLLINHPLDCPICDQGGECDLQDQALGYGVDESRFEDNKRAVEEKHMGPLVKTVMTRCIHCTRCIRFSTEVAGVPEIGAIGRGEDMEITTYLEASLDSELSGNVIDLCPVGALTSKPYAFTARPWELKKTETIDVMDAVGSNIRVDSRGREVMRILPRNHDDVNEEWLGDKSRFVWDGINRQRLDTPYIRENGKLTAKSWEQALGFVAEKVKGKGEKIAALVGDLACAESQLALKDLMGQLQSPNLDCRPAGSKLSGPRGNYLFNSTITGIEDADALIIIGGNPRVEAAVLNARIRKRWLMGDFPIARIGSDNDLTYPTQNLGAGIQSLRDLVAGKLDFIETLTNAKKPMLILSEALMSRPDGAELFNLALELAMKTEMVVDGWNGFNVLHQAAGRVAGLDIGFIPGQAGLDTGKIVEAAKSGDIETVFLLGVDEMDMSAFGDACIIYIGSHGDHGASRADVILPAAAYTEKQAIYVNTEGRPQMTELATLPPGEAREDWKIFRALSAYIGEALPYDDVSALRARLFEIAPHMAELDHVVPAGAPAKLELSKKTTGDKLLGSSISNYYFTNPIARASAIMADCAKARAERSDQGQGTGTHG